MSEIKTTLDGFVEVESRRKGNTTRQVDLAIIYLFQGFIVKCVDHSCLHPELDERTKKEQSESLYFKILQRIRNEHDGWNRLDKIKKDSKDLTIQFIFEL